MNIYRGLLQFVLLLTLATPVNGQPNWKIELFNDEHMSSCAVNYSAPGLLRINVFQTGDAPALGSSFALYPPPCLTGAVWVGDVVTPPFLFQYNTQDARGLWVAYTSCASMPIHIAEVRFFMTEAISCCEFPVSDPVDANSGIDGAQCGINPAVHALGVGAIINPTPACPTCDSPVAVSETTWGGIKSLYR